MKGNSFFHVLGIILLLFTSCGKGVVISYADYLQWLNNEKNGLVKNKEVGGITIKVKQLPSNYLAYQDLMNKEEVSKDIADSIIGSYNKSLTFLLTIGVDGQSKKGDIMYQDIKNYPAYKKRLYAMNFDIENYISLTIGKNKYRPILSHLENAYGLTESRNITLVFVPTTNNEKSFYTEDVNFTYDDELFNTGINHFAFNREDINNTPIFTFWN